MWIRIAKTPFLAWIACMTVMDITLHYLAPVGPRRLRAMYRGQGSVRYFEAKVD
jgi:hypothetical protein